MPWSPPSPSWWASREARRASWCRSSPSKAWVCLRLARGVGTLAVGWRLPHGPVTAHTCAHPSPRRQSQPGHIGSLPVPSASSGLDFQTESKMGSHQIRFVFFQCNFPFIDSFLLGGSVLLPPSYLFFFLGIWDKLLVVVLSLVVRRPAGHSFRMSAESQWLPLQEFMLISVASKTSIALCPQIQCEL